SHRFLLHDVKQRSLFRSRDAFLPRVPCFRFSFTSLAPNRGAGGAPGGGILISIALVRRDPTFARRNRPGANRNGPPGAPPRRFWARSARSVAGVASGSLARATSPPGCRARRGRGPEPPEPRIRPHPGTPHLAPPAGSSPETPLVSEVATALQYLR